MVRKTVILLLLLSASCLSQYANRNLTENLGSGALPAVCTIGDQLFATDAVAGENIYLCTAVNTWTRLSPASPVYLESGDVMFPAANPAYLQCRESTAGAPRPQWCEVLYSTGDLGTWQFMVPESYHGSTITVGVQYKMVAANANNTEWTARFACITPGDATDMDADGFAAANVSADDPVPGTAGFLAEHTWTAANTDSMAAGDSCIVQIERSTPTGADAAGDAELVRGFISW